MMYILNKDSSEVHECNCHTLSNILEENIIPLGNHDSFKSAVARAEEKGYEKANSCGQCD